MNQRQFRKSVVDQLNSSEPLDEMLHIFPLRSWFLFAIQGLLLIGASWWAVFGSVPVIVTGDARYIGVRKGDALATLYLDDAKGTVTGSTVGSTVKLVPRDGIGPTLFGKLATKLDGTIAAQPSAREAWVSLDLRDVRVLPQVGARYKAFTVIGKRAPITWFMPGLSILK